MSTRRRFVPGRRAVDRYLSTGAGAYAPQPDSAGLRVAVVGYGYWGPNLVRNVVERPELELAALCERDPRQATAFQARVPGVPVTPDLDVVLADPTVDAVIVATPPKTHHALVKAALQAGKHVLVEKPLATTAADARDLIDVARQRDLVLMPGHTFLYSPAVNKVRQLIQDDVLGEVYFVTSSRMNLGKYQPDGVICDLAPHDISILLYLLEQRVTQVAASARSVFQDHVPETAFLTLTFEGGAAANVQISWLAPRKVRQMVVVGSKRMVVYDDTAADESVRVYDRGMEFSTPESFGEYNLTYRSGDIVVPRLEPAEPLSLELQDFAAAIVSGQLPRSHAALGLEIVEALEAAEASLRRHGAPVELNPARLEAAA
jgi:predicted dehydrogenase